MEIQESLYKNYYKTQASRYGAPGAQSETHRAQHYKKEIGPLLSKNKDIKILEIGCGQGFLISFLQANGYKNIIGYDLSEEQVNRGVKSGITCIKKGDFLDHLKTGAGKYDLIIGLDVIEHLKKNELLDLLRSSYASLSANGKVLFRTPNGDAPFGSTYYYGDFTHHLVLNSFSAEQILLNAGFTDISVSPSIIFTKGFIKELFRKVLWVIVKVLSKTILFASGKSTRSIILTPNLIITATK